MPNVDTLVDQVELPNPLSPDEVAALTPVVPDSIHQGIPPVFSARSHHSTFIDYNGSVALRNNIKAAIHDSIASAFLLFGFPDDHPGTAMQCIPGSP